MANEGTVSDTVVCILERRERQLRADVFRPDAIGRASQADFMLKLSAQIYALEHTEIEAPQAPPRTRPRPWARAPDCSA